MSDINELVQSLMGQQQPQMFDTFGGPTGGIAKGNGYANLGRTLEPYSSWAKDQPGLGYMRAMGNIPINQQWLNEGPHSTNVEDRRLEHKHLGGYRDLIKEMDAEGLSQAPAAQAFLTRRGDFKGPLGNIGAPLPQPNPLRSSGLIK